MPIVVLAEERICGQQACLPHKSIAGRIRLATTVYLALGRSAKLTPIELASRQTCREYVAAYSATRASHGSRLVPTSRAYAGCFCSSESLRVGGCGLDL